MSFIKQVNMEMEDKLIADAKVAANHANKFQEVAAKLSRWKVSGGQLPETSIRKNFSIGYHSIDPLHPWFQEQQMIVDKELHLARDDQGKAVSWKEELQRRSMQLSSPAWEHAKIGIASLLKCKEEGQDAGALFKQAAMIKMHMEALRPEMVILSDLDQYIDALGYRINSLKRQHDVFCLAEGSAAARQDAAMIEGGFSFACDQDSTAD